MADQLQVTIGADVTNLEQGLKKAETALDKFSAKTKPLVASTNQANTALVNLGRVASDAPFGFIAIQNNLDPLIQSFGQLSKSSGGVGGALKSLAGSLAGPAGIGLAFTAVSAAVTVAIQKYGSLGSAVDALFGKINPLSEEIRSAADSYEKFNQAARTSEQILRDEAASVEGTISKIDSLVAIVQDQTRSYDERNNALNTLKGINKDYFGDLDIEAGKVEGLTSAVSAYKNALIQLAVQKGFEAEIGKTSVQLREQENLLKQLGERLKEARAAPVRFVGKADRVDTREIDEANAAYTEQAIIVDKLRNSFKELQAGVNESVDQYNKITAPINAANEVAKKAAELAKQTEAAQKRAAAAAGARAKKEAEAAAQLAANQAEALRLAQQEQAFKIKFDLGALSASADDAYNAYRAEIEAKAAIPIRISATIPPEVTQTFEQFAEKQRQALAIDQIQAVGAAFNDFVGPAIDAVFGALESGQNVFKALGDSLKKLIIQLALTVAKAAALALILTLVTGGGAGLAGFGANFTKVLGGGVGGGGGGLGALLSSGLLRGGSVMSGGMSTESMGGLAMSGQVTFVQRGSDLVGVLDRTNSRIGRVG